MMLRQRTKDQALSEDLHQDTFRVVIERLRNERSIAEPEKLSGFIHRTAVNICIDHNRKINRRQTYTGSESFEYVPDPGLSQLSSMIESERSTLVRTVIGELSMERDRDLLRRFYVLEQDKVQICEHYSLSSDNFDRVISRARKRFRTAIAKRMAQLNVDEI